MSYETGQPTHCYDALKVHEPLMLNFLDKETEFDTLLDKKINISEGDLVFCDKDRNIINLAGVVVAKIQNVSINTKSAIIECAYFNPEVIIGKIIEI